MAAFVIILLLTFSFGCGGGVSDSRTTNDKSTEVLESENATAGGGLDADASGDNLSDEPVTPQPKPLPESSGSGSDKKFELFADVIPSYLSEMCKGSVTKDIETEKRIFGPSYIIKAGSLFFALKFSNSNYTWAKFFFPDGGHLVETVPHDSATFECDYAAVDSLRGLVTNDLTLYYDEELSLEACRVEAGHRITQRFSGSWAGKVGWLHTQSGEDLAIKPGCSAPKLYYERETLPDFGGLERLAFGDFYLNY